MNLEDFWNEALSQFKEDLDEGEFAFWFSSIRFNSSTQSQITLSVPSLFFRDQLKTKYLKNFESKLHDLTGQEITFEFLVIKGETPKQEKPDRKELKREVEEVPTLLPPKEKSKKNAPFLNPTYTLENFVMGKNNEFAYSCAVAISKEPGVSFNPFLIYGGVGLGKTHLMQAIGNAIHQNNEKLNIIYIPSENFINEFMLAIQNKTQSQFKNKYRNVDVLLLDDIHDLQKKKDTQEELFNTFNALYEAKKHLVFTCDRPPQELKDFSDRLQSRLSRAVIADLQLPSWETRFVILKKKSETKKSRIPDSVLELIAKNVTTNIRDLEAALNQICAYADLINREITVDVAQNQLRHIFAGPAQQNISIDLVQKVVAEHYKLGVQDLKGKKRTQAITLPRQVAMFLVRELTEYSTTEVGTDFGGRDHTTVMHAVQKIEDKIKTEPSFEITLQSLKRSVLDKASSS